MFVLITNKGPIFKGSEKRLIKTASPIPGLEDVTLNFSGALTQAATFLRLLSAEMLSGNLK